MEATVKVSLRYVASDNASSFGKYILDIEDPQGHSFSVRLKFEFDALWRLSQDTQTTAFDFLVFSMAVYNTDRVVSRAKYSTDGWNRRIKLTVPVVNLADMNVGKDSLVSALNFLTGDDWDLEFVQAPTYCFQNELPLEETAAYEIVSLFSGGLDSLIGFIDGCHRLGANKKILLVSHKELGKEWSDQVRILDICRTQHLYDDKYKQVLINAGIINNGWYGEKAICEGTFRARSIIFIGAGIYCANSLAPNMPLIIPENGTISLNIPLDRGRRSACSTKTTHPVFLRRLQKALTEIGINNPLINPYQTKSKADMVVDCCQDDTKRNALQILYGASCSCAKRSHKKTWARRRDALGHSVLHCGFCLPCIYRRVSLNQVGWDTETVGIDVFASSELNPNDTITKKGRDFRSLLNFLNSRCNRDTIEAELISNGISDLQELEEYTDFILHSYDQVKDWIRTNVDDRIKHLAGL